MNASGTGAAAVRCRRWRCRPPDRHAARRPRSVRVHGDANHSRCASSPRRTSASWHDLPGRLDYLVEQGAGGASAISAVAAAAWVAERSRRVRVDPSPFLPPASSTRSSIAARIAQRSRANRRNAKIKHRKATRSQSTVVRQTRAVGGHEASSATQSWLPVPHKPNVCAKCRRGPGSGSALFSATTDGAAGRRRQRFGEHDVPRGWSHAASISDGTPRHRKSTDRAVPRSATAAMPLHRGTFPRELRRR